MSKVIDNWRKATDELAKEFTKKYFPEERWGKDTFWVGDEIGSVFCVADMFFDVDRMITALENNATFDQLYDYYHAEVDWCIENHNKPYRINFKNYVKYGDINENM